jgi:16S rRNA (guanine966-N2)-methyltransferase
MGKNFESECVGMRILSGTFKNRTLFSPKGGKTRPTSSKMRASVFNILQGLVEGADFLDVFAGSGAMGFEALSRGAASATFIERDAQAARCIRQNLKTLGINGKILQRDASLALKQLDKKYDIIYIDPPYDLEITPLLKLLPSLIKDGGSILVEQSSRVELDVSPLTLENKRTYGDSVLYFLSAELS